MITTQEIEQLAHERDCHREEAHRLNRKLHELRRVERQRIASEKAEARRAMAGGKRAERQRGNYETFRLRVLLADAMRAAGCTASEIENVIGVRLTQLRQNRKLLQRAGILSKGDTP